MEKYIKGIRKSKEIKKRRFNVFDCGFCIPFGGVEEGRAVAQLLHGGDDRLAGDDRLVVLYVHRFAHQRNLDALDAVHFFQGSFYPCGTRRTGHSRHRKFFFHADSFSVIVFGSMCNKTLFEAPAL